MSDGKRHSWISAILFTMMECVIGGFQHINSLLISNKIDRNLILNTISNTTMTNAFSKTFGCITQSDIDELITQNYKTMYKYNLLRVEGEKRGELSKKEFINYGMGILYREVLYLVYGFKPNKVFIINC